MSNLHHSEKGQALIATAITLLVFFGLAALAVDFGHLAHTLNEMQIVADSAATAGAQRLVTDLAQGQALDVASSQASADGQSIAGQNNLDGQPAQPSQVQLLTGTYDSTSKTFSAGSTQVNAMQVTVSASVHDLLGAFIGVTTDWTFTRRATAALIVPPYVTLVCDKNTEQACSS